MTSVNNDKTISGLKFKNITGETERRYLFPHVHGPFTVTIKEPAFLNVSPCGGHRVLDQKGSSHFIPSGWVQISWETEPGCENFYF